MQMSSMPAIFRCRTSALEHHSPERRNADVIGEAANARSRLQQVLAKLPKLDAPEPKPTKQVKKKK
jgi:hypothetical protein